MTAGIRRATLWLNSATLSANVFLLCWNLSRARYWLARVAGLLLVLVVHTLLMRRRIIALRKYFNVLIDRVVRVSDERLGEEPFEEAQARFLALKNAIERGYGDGWLRPWKRIEDCARDLELFGVDIQR